MRSKKNYIFALLICLASVVAFILVSSFRFPSPQESRYKEIGGDFTLISDQRLVSLLDFRGQVVLLFFGFTSCPDICPTELARIAAAFRKLSKKEIDQTQGIFISIDPQRDTIKKVSAHAQFFHTNIIGLTGSTGEVKRVANKYFAFYEKVENKDDETEYMIDHSVTTYIIGRDGRVAELIKRDVTSSELAQAIRTALRS